MIPRYALNSLGDDERAMLLFIINEQYGEERYSWETIPSFKLEKVREKVKAAEPKIKPEALTIYQNVRTLFGV